MSRNKIEANKKIFNRLDDFCQSRGVLLETHGRPRWLATTSPERYILVKLQVRDVTGLGGGRHLGYGLLDSKNYLIASGFELAAVPSGFEEIELGPGFLSAILAEFSVPVAASPYEVKDVVDLHDKTSPDYEGHDYTEVAKLFPSIRVFVSEKALQSPWNSFFQLCLHERSQGLDPIDRELSESLFALAELNPNLLPYRVMCRSIFDVDPSSFFLALYRCFESLYSFTSSKELGRRFKIDDTWQDIAATIESVTGWYPKEQASLEALLRIASAADLEKLVRATGGELLEGQSPSIKAAKIIYSIRNAAVHYRPAHQSNYLETIDWANICNHMVGLILDVYAEAGQNI